MGVNNTDKIRIADNRRRLVVIREREEGIPAVVVVVVVVVIVNKQFPFIYRNSNYIEFFKLGRYCITSEDRYLDKWMNR